MKSANAQISQTPDSTITPQKRVRECFEVPEHGAKPVEAHPWDMRVRYPHFRMKIPEMLKLPD